MAGEGPEAGDMLSTLQAMSAHGGHMGNLGGVLNNPMQAPFGQQVLLHSCSYYLCHCAGFPI